MTKATAGTAGVRDIYLDANGLRHHLIARGTPGQPAVMMLHGLAGQARVFDGIANLLAASYHVYCLDVRGRGETEWGPADGYHTANYVADLEAVREGLGLERMALVGTSMGGIISMYYASQYGERVTKVALNDVGPETSAAGLARIVEYVGKAPEMFADMKAVVKYYREHYAPMVAHLNSDEVAEFARHHVRKSDSGVVVWKMDPAIRKFAPPPGGQVEPWTAYRGLTCPVLVLRGAESDILSAETAAKMAETHPGARAVTVPGVGHAPVLTEPAAVQALEAFLAE